MIDRQFLLSPRELPRQWYNIVADLDEPPPPPLHPGTQQPVTPDDLAPIFPMSLIAQEASAERWIPIPEEVLDVLSIWRPTPVFRATRWEKALGTPAKIFYKWEGVSPVGSHKPNTAVAQAYYNKLEGITRLATETGAGQWGSALSMATRFFGLDCTVYMVKVSYNQKPYRKSMMQMYGATIYASPSEHTAFGRQILEKDPDCPGSLGIAISEALEDAVANDKVKYSLGSVLNHVLLHQTVIGLEAKKQMEMAGCYPDVVIGCVGGGSNFAGLVFPFVPDKLAGKNIRFVAVEPTSCPTLTKGPYKYDFGDTAKMTPLLKMHTLGSEFIPPSIHAGGLRYHGMAPLVSLLVQKGHVQPRAYSQAEVFEASVSFTRAEGIISAPETSHALKAAMDEALEAKKEGKERVILFNHSGHGLLDLGAYDAYLSGKLTNG
ncbi:MAG: TrpB-like pyridoxal phosphate-dependent enzyme [Armatimonadetes bacterium]|nr:TrpB-like pyridoxal phosphate-dependent enzyme [Armatimonadota bacterium]